MRIDQRTLGTATAWASTAALVFLAGWVGRRLWFFSDDWNILAEYHDGGLLEPFNGHLSLLPAGAYQLMFEVFGTGSYLPYRLVGLASLVVLGFQVIRLTSARLDWSNGATWFAALAVTAVLWNPAGSTNVMFPFLVNFSLPIAALVAIWWNLDRSSTRGDVAASLWLAVALASSGLGVMALVAVAVELVVGRAPLRRWMLLGPAPALWALWFLGNAGSNEWSTDPSAVLSYSLRMLLGATTSLAAGWAGGGVLLFVALVGMVVVAATRWQSLDGRALGALSAPVAFVASTALTRQGVVPAIPPDELRYAWTIAAYLVFVVVVLWRPEPWLRDRPALTRTAAVVAGVAVLVGAVQLQREVREWADVVAQARPRLTSVLLATELTGAEHLGPDRVLPLSYVPVTVGGYLDAVAGVGSPVSATEPTPVAEGALADELLLEGVEPVAVPEAGPTGCSDEGAAGAPGRGELEVPAGATILVGSQADTAAVGISRFSNESAAVRREGPGGRWELRLPADLDAQRGAALPYRVLPEGDATVAVCR